MQRRDFAGRIAANARSLSAVVQDLLDFSLLDRGAEPLVLAPIELGRLVEGVVDRLAPVFTDHQIVLHHRAVAADRRSVQRPRAGGHEPAHERREVLARRVDGHRGRGPPRDGGAVVVVSDEGPGVPLDERQQVFTRFYRGSGDAVLQTRGVGIGLSVVAELVARMDGEITLDDAPGGGARFTVWLPASDALRRGGGPTCGDALSPSFRPWCSWASWPPPSWSASCSAAPNGAGVHALEESVGGEVQAIAASQDQRFQNTFARDRWALEPGPALRAHRRQ